MSNATFTPSALHPATCSPAPSLWRELIRATPLAVLLQSLKAPANAR